MNSKSRLAVKRTRPRGYIANYKPQQRTVRLLEDVRDVLEGYEQYLPLTIRQCFYVLVGRYGYPKEERFYARLCEHVGNARRGRSIPFSAIRDDDVAVVSPDHYADEDAFWGQVRFQAQTYKRDKLARQRYHIEVWCEAAGMVPQLARVAERYSVEVWSCSGFDSLSAKKDLADRVCKKSKPAVILHLGDLDSWGKDIFTALHEDVRAFVLKDRPHYLVDVEFRRVALTREQVTLYNLPTAPPKESAKGRGPAATCQLEALPPNTVAALLRSEIERVLDVDLFNADTTAEVGERQRIAYALPSPNGKSA